MKLTETQDIYPMPSPSLFQGSAKPSYMPTLSSVRCPNIHCTKIPFLLKLIQVEFLCITIKNCDENNGSNMGQKIFQPNKAKTKNQIQYYNCATYQNASTEYVERNTLK